MAAKPGEGARGFRFRRLEKPEEFRSAEELQREALGEDAGQAVPASLLRTFQDTGGLVLGAFADIYLAGLSVSSLGWDGSILYHQTHTTAVRTEYRSHHVGLRLLAYHRDEVLALGLSEVRGSIDPLESRTAHLALHRLGARPDGYLPNYFGRRSEAGSSDVETDRLHLRWSLQDPTVVRRLEGTAAPPEELERRGRGSHALVETELGETGLRIPRAVVEPEHGPAHLEIPFDLATLRTHEAAAVRRWRHAVRDAFRLAFELGYVAEDFLVTSIDHERRSFYLLGPGPARAQAPGPSRSPG